MMAYENPILLLIHNIMSATFKFVVIITMLAFANAKHKHTRHLFYLTSWTSFSAISASKLPAQPYFFHKRRNRAEKLPCSVRKHAGHEPATS